MFKTHNPPAIIRYHSGYKAEIVKEFESSSSQPVELIMDYMLKHINQIDETRKNFKSKYPDILPTL